METVVSDETVESSLKSTAVSFSSFAPSDFNSLQKLTESLRHGFLSMLKLPAPLRRGAGAGAGAVSHFVRIHSPKVLSSWFR